jgi:hypothetical protein
VTTIEDAYIGRLANVVIEVDVRARRVWCLRCAVRTWYVASQDGGAHSCGYSLSLYGPFEELPSFCPTPTPLEPRWAAR